MKNSNEVKATKVVTTCEACGGTGRIHGVKLCQECLGKGGFIDPMDNKAKATPRPLEKCLFPNCEKDRDSIAFCKEHSEKHSQHCEQDRQGWGIKTW